MPPACDVHEPALRVNRALFPVLSLGHGRRLALWLQGCSLGCRGCVTPHLWPPHGVAARPARVLARALVERFPGTEGVTLVGGEPFEQMEAVSAFGEEMTALGISDIGVYTGFTLQELDARWPGRPWMAWVRWLVDGRYDASLAADDGWRGSTNQRMYRIESDALVEEPAGFVPGPWSVVQGSDGVLLAGIPRQGDMDALRGALLRASARGRFV